MLMEWVNDPEIFGEYQTLTQGSREEVEKMLGGGPLEKKVFMIEKKDGTKIGYIGYTKIGPYFEIGYLIIPNERRKGYGTEAIKVIVDYLFLSQATHRIQARTDVRNVASVKTLEKAGFKKEGILRKFGFLKGEWADTYSYSIIREEWKEPKILTKG